MPTMMDHDLDNPVPLTLAAPLIVGVLATSWTQAVLLCVGVVVLNPVCRRLYAWWQRR